jgi:hypothetical protein
MLNWIQFVNGQAFVGGTWVGGNEFMNAIDMVRAGDGSNGTPATGATIDSAVKMLFLGGYYSLGDGGHALYKKVTEDGSALKPWQFRSNANTVRWELVADPAEGVNTRQLGAKHDANGSIANSLTTAFTGTDDTAAIQATIDYAIYSGAKCKVRIAAGNTRITKTIHLGYGEAFRSVIVEGAGQKLLGESGFNGTCVFVDLRDSSGVLLANGPAFNIQGARKSALRDITIVGKAGQWIYSHDLGGGGYTLDDTVGANWVDTGLPAAATSRFSPYCGVCVDAYSGGNPSLGGGVETYRYPDITYPEYSGIPRTISNAINSPTTPGLIRITVSSTSSWTTGSSVNVSGVGGVTNANGTWNVTVINGTTADLQGTTFSGTYTSGTGTASQQRAKSLSSDFSIERVTVNGFIVGIMVQPTTDGNGDFGKVNQVQMQYCYYGMAIGNSQARNTSITDPVFSFVFVGLSNNTWGYGIGKINGPIINAHIDNSINLCSLTSSWTGPVKFINAYSESLWRIGHLSAGSYDENAVEFDHCQFDMGLQVLDGHGGPGTKGRGIPATLMSGGSGAFPAHVVFNGCGFVQMGCGTFSSRGANITFRNQRVDATSSFVNASSGTTEGSRIAMAATCGGLWVGTGPVRPNINSFNFDTLSVTGSGQAQGHVTDGVWAGGREYPTPLLAKWVCGYGDLNDQPVLQPVRTNGAVQANGSNPSASLTDCVLTFDYPGRSNAGFHTQGPDVGDYIREAQTGTLFRVTARTGSVATARAVTNYRLVGGVRTLIDAFPASAGSSVYYTTHFRLYTPAYPIYGDTTAGAFTITNAGTYAGLTTLINSSDNGVVVGDYLNYDNGDPAFPPVFPTEAKITAISGGTITMDKAALLTVTKRRFHHWIRQPPANDSITTAQ